MDASDSEDGIPDLVSASSSEGSDVSESESDAESDHEVYTFGADSSDEETKDEGDYKPTYVSAKRRWVVASLSTVCWW